MVTISYLPEFLRQAKRLTKKYPSFPEDLKTITEELSVNPLVGSDLGSGIRKVRVAIKSKGKGKRGGARVITFNLAVSGDNTDVTLLTVYDKSEKENISDSEIKALMNKAGL